MAHHPLQSIVAELTKAMREIKTASGNNYENLKLFFEQSQTLLKQELKKDLEEKMEDLEGRMMAALSELLVAPASSTARAITFTRNNDSLDDSGTQVTSNAQHFEPLGPLDIEWLVPMSEQMANEISNVDRVLLLLAKENQFGKLVDRLR